MNFAHTVNASYMQALRPCSSSSAALPAKTREQDQTAPAQAPPQNVNPQSQGQIRYYSAAAESAHVPATPKAAPMPSATAMRKRVDSQSAGESGSLS
jgi:hypothetical protein